MCPLDPPVMPWHCCAVGSSHARGGRGPVGAAVRLWLGGRIRRGDGALPRTQPGCSPPPCLQCQHLCEPCRTPDMCFHLAQTMTRPVLACEWMCSSLDTDLSPVPPQTWLWPLHVAAAPCSTRPRAPRIHVQPTLGASWPQSTTATQPSLALGLAISPGLTHPPSPALTAPQHLLWPQGCASSCPCYLVPACPLG